MREIEVSTKEELKKSVDVGYDEISIRGELAQKVATAYKIKKYSKVAIGALATALAATAITGPIGMAFAAPIVAVTGMEIAIIIAVAMLGFALVMALTDKYELEVDIGKDEKGDYRIKVIKKKSATA